MKKNLIITKLIMALISISLVVSGCGENPETNSIGISGSYDNKSSTYNYDGEKVSVHLENIPSVSGIELYETTAERFDFSDYANALNQNFFDKDGAEYAEYEINDDDGYKITEYSWQLVRPDNWWDYLTVYGPQFYLVYDSDYVYYFFTNCIRMDENANAYDLYPEEYRFNADKYEGVEIEGFSKEEALGYFRNMMKQSGIDIGELDYTALGVTSKMAAKEWYDLDKNSNVPEKPDFSNMRDTWYFLARQSEQGLPVFYYGFTEDLSLQLQSSPIKFSVDEQGIEYISIDRIFTFTKQKKKLGPLLSFDEIIPDVIGSYDELLGSSKYEINKCGLYYYALGNGNHVNYNMVPIWAFEVKEVNKNDMSKNHTTLLLINALTGEEMEKIK